MTIWITGTMSRKADPQAPSPVRAASERCRHHEGMRLEDVRLLGEVDEFAGIRLQQTEGRHGSDTIMALLGIALARSAEWSSHPAEKKDSIWPATPSGMPRLNKCRTGTNPRSSSQLR